MHQLMNLWFDHLDATLVDTAEKPCKITKSTSNKQIITHLLTKFFVFRFKTLAVTTPGGVELDENILALIIHNGIEVLSH